ncbi:MAG: exonuclease SbcCD subunit D [Lachnospiraceae bacterium]|nr:exonuclease SbcCD subunit D [Lachnospiraceae bacterium]
MKFIHLADLHLGKTIHGVSLIDNRDQLVWVERFLTVVKEIRPDAILIAGDVYDRSAPGGEAVELFDHMLTELENDKIPVLLIAGNHDSGQRLSFAGDILAKQNIYIAGKVEKELVHVELSDEFGKVTFYLMPYLFPALAAEKLSDESIKDYDTAIRRMIAEQEIDFSQRNVMIAHQNVVCNGKTVEFGGSESMVGGVGQVDYSAFDGFDYVALGHIHSSYHVGRKSVRYAGSPLCYHFDEIRQPQKGPVLVTMNEKGAPVSIKTIVIDPLHRMREIKGSYDKVKKELEDHRYAEEYLRVVITDRRISPEISELIRSLCKGRNSIVMELVSEHREHGITELADGKSTDGNRTVEEYFEELYIQRNHETEPEEKDRSLFRFIGEQVRHADEVKKKSEPDEKEVDKLLNYLLSQEEKV